MPIRYTDLSTNASGTGDFIIRKRTPSVTQLLLLFAIALIVSVSVTITVADTVALIAVLFITLGSIAWYTVIQIQRDRDLVLTTEFQNALFASALGINNKFCLIIKRDGNIIYLDRSFQEMFPSFHNTPRRTVDVLLEYARVSQEESAKIFSAIERGTYDKVIFNIRDANGESHHIIMSIEPILRPSGFILLRGREYIEQRQEWVAADAVTPPTLTKPTITLFSHVIDNMQMGVYMTSPDGHIIYTSPLLDEWLGFSEGEILSGNLMLQDIVQHGGTTSDVNEPANYEGHITLKKKAGGLTKAFINQKIIRNEQGKVMGCTAIVHHGEDTSADVKKKLW